MSPGITTVTRLPATMVQVRTLMASLDYKGFQREIQQELGARIAIVGPVNCGKSTLFNLLQGSARSEISPVPGTTRTLIRDAFGPFTLVDTPGFGDPSTVALDRTRVALAGIDEATLVIQLIDAAAGLRDADVGLHQTIRDHGKPVVVVLNKIDLLKQSDLARVLPHARARLGVEDIIPISALKETNVTEQLIPALIDRHPEVAMAIGRALPQFRRRAANKLIRRAMAVNAAVGTEPIPGLDLPILIASHVRLVLRIAALYGENLTAERAKEMVMASLGTWGIRYVGQQLAKLVPVGGWAVSGAVSAAGAWAIGQAAVEYFESGKTLSTRQLQDRFRTLLKRGSSKEGLQQIEAELRRETREEVEAEEEGEPPLALSR